MASKNNNYRNFGNRKAFNNRPCKENEELVPVALTEELRPMLKRAGLDWNNVETRHMPQPVPVVFVPHAKGNMDNVMKCFYKEVSRYLQHKYEPTSDDLSLDEFMDNMNDDNEAGFDPTGSTEALDDTVILADLLNALIEDLNHIDTRYG